MYMRKVNLSLFKSFRRLSSRDGTWTHTFPWLPARVTLTVLTSAQWREIRFIFIFYARQLSKNVYSIIRELMQPSKLIPF